MKKIIIVTGQTATGKTKLALEYAQEYYGELINCDSRQIYKKLDIVTGKDRPKGIKIRLYDLIDPKEYFSSYDFAQHALPLINKFLQEKKTPIIVGGTYLYLKHLLYDIETEKIPPDWKLRQRLENKTVLELQNLLRKGDLMLFNKLNNSEKNNPQRLIRKIEIASYNIKHKALEPPRLRRSEATGKPRRLSEILAKKLKISNLDIEFIGLKFKDKNKLRQTIKNRVEERLKKGAVKEVKDLLKQGYTAGDPGLKTIGYQQIIKYLNGKLSQEKTIEEWITKEIQYAKRQYTFMKIDPNITWREI